MHLGRVWEDLGRVLGGLGEGLGRFLGGSGCLWGALEASPGFFFSCFGIFLGSLAIFSMFLVNF